MKARIFLVTAILMSCFIVRVDAATRVFQTAGNWSLATNWQGSAKPVAGDDVIIAATCTVDENIAVHSFLSLTVNTGVNLFLGTYQLVFTGTVTNNGFIYTENTSSTPIPAGKTWGGRVNFGAPSAQTIPAGTYAALKTEASGVSRTVSAGGDITVTDELYVEGFTSSNESILDMGQWRLLGTPTYTWVTGRLRTANTSTTPLPAGMRWYSNMPMRQGIVEFYATSPQHIPGGVYDNDVILTGANTKTLQGVMTSNGVLTLSQAVLVIMDSNAVIGVTGSINAGPAIFSATNMIATMGSGSLVKQFSGGGSFTYPIGELTGTAEYTPVALQIPAVAGAFTKAARVVNAKHPENTSTASYINRYWSIDVSASVMLWNATFSYTQADVVGPEDNMYTGQWAGTQWTQFNKADTLNNQLSATAAILSGDFTGYEVLPTVPCIIDARILLQGAAIDSSGAMRTTLNNASLLPLQQPYNASPWNYSGSEQVLSIPSANVVDWVLLELRSTPTGSAVDRRAGFLLSNGVIVDMDGTSPVSFDTLSADDYYLVVRHRNHLAVMSAVALQVSPTTARYDFTSAGNQAYGSDAMIGLASGQAPFALWGGDANADGVLKYTGTGNDAAAILARIGASDITLTLAGYHPEDTDMNGVVQYSGAGNDRAMILRNIGGVDINNQRSSHVP